MKFSRLSWRATASIIAIVLVLCIFLVTYLSDTSSHLLEWEFLRGLLEGPVLIIYILAIYPFMWRLRNQALQAFKPILHLDNSAFTRLAAEVTTPKRRWEWTSVLIGVGVAFALGQPWNLPWGPGELWWSVYLVITSALMNGLLAWLIYDTLTGAVRINRLSRRDLKLDIFDTEILTPIARWSLGISLAFIGGISLSLVFGTQESLLRWQSITMYVILVCVTVLIFFISMWSAHGAMARVKRRELQLVQQHLRVASSKLKERAADGRLEGMEKLSSTITAWVNYERRVKEAPEWPFNAGIIRRLMASTLAPVAVFLIKVLSRLGISM